jgi:hypothetical protein
MSKNKKGVDMYGNYGKGQLHDEHWDRVKRQEQEKLARQAWEHTQMDVLHPANLPEVSSSVRGDDLRRVQEQLARLAVAAKWAAVIVIGVLAIGYMAPK